MKPVFRILILLLICLSSVTTMKAQTIQWANKILGVTNEYDSYQRGARQVLGYPNVRPQGGLSQQAWCVKPEGSRESVSASYITVSFAKPMPIQQVAVFESASPGAVVEIYVFDEANNSKRVYQAKPSKAAESYRILRCTFPLTKKPIYAVKVILENGMVDGWNQIDAIAISDSEAPIQRPEINLSADIAFTAAPEKLSANINSRYSEALPQISPDGQSLFFIRYDHPDNINGPEDDIYLSEKQADGSWGLAKNLGSPLNNSGSNSVSTILPDGNTLMLGSENSYTNSGKPGPSVSRRTAKGWGFPKPMNIADMYNMNPYKNYYLSPDGQTLILAIERKDSYGDMDLYFSKLQPDGGWTAPQNMGATINTVAEEASPFLAADGQTLYFGSSGHPGFGDMDLFVSRRLDDSWTNWSKPVNLGKPLNTPEFDAYFTIPADGEYAYYVSYENQTAESDIYRIVLPAAAKPKPVALVYGQVLNAKTRQPIEAGVRYEFLPKGDLAGEAASNAQNGRYAIVLPVGSEYGFLAQAKGYAAVSDFVDTRGITGYQKIERNLYLNPIESGEIVRLNNLFFDTDLYELKPASFAELDRLVKLLKDNPTLTIEIRGHTDNTGKADQNLTLSANRAKAVADYLKAKGVPAEKLTSQGYGDTQPIADNATDLGKQTNRRVEFKILKQ